MPVEDANDGDASLAFDAESQSQATRDSLNDEAPGGEPQVAPLDPLFGGGLSLSEAFRQLRLRLLDLTARNRLLNFKHSPARTLQFVEAKLALTFSQLVDAQNGRIDLKPVPEPARNEWMLLDGRRQRPPAREYAATRGIGTVYQLSETNGTAEAGLLQTLYYPDELERFCRRLARDAKLAIEETGANILYLVVGFLEFPDTRQSDRTLLAPLLAIPVALEKGTRDPLSGSHRYYLQSTGEELTENLSLREKLRAEYAFELPPVESNGEDSREILEDYFNTIARSITQKEGWHLRRQLTLGLLSFTKMLLVRDMNPANWPLDSQKNSSLLDHPIVRQLFQGSEERGSDDMYATDHVVDEHPQCNMPLIYDADSSQHSALIDALGGRNMVIEGPPGTGKSQTITNLIGVAIANGKTVLFVSEKLAALQVVKQRLERAGLGDFCLELHGTKVAKKRVIDDLRQRIQRSFSAPAGLSNKLDSLEQKRKGLKAYTDFLSSVQHNAQDMSVHAVVWRAERYRMRCGSAWTQLRDVQLTEATTLGAGAFEVRVGALDAVSRSFEHIGVFGPESTFWGFFPTDLASDLDLRVEPALSMGREAARQLEAAQNDAARFLGGEHVRLSSENANALLSALAKLSPTHPEDVAFDLLPRQFSTVDPGGDEAEKTLGEFAQKLRRCSELDARIGRNLRDPSTIVAEDGPRSVSARNALRDLGLLRQPPTEVEVRAGSLHAACGVAEHGLQALTALGETASEPFMDTPESLERLSAIVQSAAEAPRAHLHLRHPGLCHAEAVATLQLAISKRGHITSEQRRLEERMFLDVPPSENELAEAISTLREGSTWYRFLQPQWRKAVATHRRLAKEKRRCPAQQRLQELVDLYHLAKEREAWRKIPRLQESLGPNYRDDDSPLRESLELAKWARKTRERYLESGLQPEHALFDAAESRLVQVGALKPKLDAAVASLVGLDQCMRQQFGLFGETSAQWQVARTFAARLKFAQECHARLSGVLKAFTQWGAADVPTEQALVAVEAAALRPSAVAEAEGDRSARTLFGLRFNGLRTLLDPAHAALAYGRQVVSLRLPTPLHALLLSEAASDNHAELINLFMAVEDAWRRVESFAGTMQHIGSFELELFAGAKSDEPDFAARLGERLERARFELSSVLSWAEYNSVAGQARDLGLGTFVDRLEHGTLPPKSLSAAFGYRFYHSIAETIFRSNSASTRFFTTNHGQLRRDFAALDREVIQLRGLELGKQAHEAAHPPAGHGGVRVDDRTEMALVNHLIPQQRPRVPVRKLLRQAGRAVQALKPCFMMSPHTVAQFLEPGALRFDIVVMDEASQLKPEEALGAVARGKQLIVVGDPNQLPPTVFFDKFGQTDDEDGEAALLQQSSILDVCLEHFRPRRRLRWHYRSQHESLIAFSNSRYYGGSLFIFPSAYARSARLGVHNHFISGATYANQKNELEARHVVDAVLTRMREYPEESIGVVTLALRQRDFIADLLDDKMTDDPKYEAYRQRWEMDGQAPFVKNLENVQGDERDVIFISTTFGPVPNTNVVRQNFGPISRNNGWRRLNVLFTRAKRAVHLFTSMRPSDIKDDPATPRGTRELKAYLDYAVTGNLVQPEVDQNATSESPFEESVSEVLIQAGYTVVPQLGVAGYRIDIAVRHPQYPSVYLAGIECDGATYHSGVSVRDRDRIRQEILESLGWRDRIWRIWSTDWFRRPQDEAVRLCAFLQRVSELPLDHALIEPLTVVPEPEDELEDLTLPEPGYTAPLYESPTSQPPEASQPETQYDDEIEVEVGDTVAYASLNAPHEEIVVQITQRTTDLERAMISQSTPLAQVILGAVVGDEVVLRVPSHPPKTFIIKKISRQEGPDT
jgi:Protein of unknown function (DUF4011)/REase_MTES_1575/AAA domain/Transcription elongation factor, GreA/GreB, C-term